MYQIVQTNLVRWLLMAFKRRFLAVALVLLGLGLCAYGLAFHVITVHPEKDDAAAVATSEPATVKEVSIGGLKRDETGKIRQTYTGEAPQSCPT
jgi:predicted alpha/beta-fold hydrolase